MQVVQHPPKYGLGRFSVFTYQPRGTVSFSRHDQRGCEQSPRHRVRRVGAISPLGRDHRRRKVARRHVRFADDEVRSPVARVELQRFAPFLQGAVVQAGKLYEPRISREPDCVCTPLHY